MYVLAIALILATVSCSQYDVIYSGQLPKKRLNTLPAETEFETWTDGPPPSESTEQILGDCNAPVRLSEVHVDPKRVADRLGEYIELYNPNPAPVRLNGWRLSDSKRDGHTITANGPVVIGAHSYLVLGINSNLDTNGGVPVAYEYQRFTLANDRDTIRLEDACGNTVVQLTYPGPRGWAKVRAGYAMERVDRAESDRPQKWRRARTRHQKGDRGSPGTGAWSTSSTEEEDGNEPLQHEDNSSN